MKKEWLVQPFFCTVDTGSCQLSLGTRFLHFRFAFLICIFCLHFKIAFHICTLYLQFYFCNLYLNSVFAILVCISYLYFVFAFHICNFYLRFKFAFHSCKLHLRFRFAFRICISLYICMGSFANSSQTLLSGSQVTLSESANAKTHTASFSHNCCRENCFYV